MNQRRRLLIKILALLALLALILSLIKNKKLKEEEAEKGNQGAIIQEDSYYKDLSFMKYEGAILSLSRLKDGQDLKVERNISLDFSQFKNPGPYLHHLDIQDNYLIKKTEDGGERSFIYPIVSNLNSGEKNVPKPLNEGKILACQLHIGQPITQWNGDELTGSYLDIKKSLDKNYMEENIKREDKIENPQIIIYEIKNSYGKKSEQAPAPTIALEYEIDYEKSQVYSYRMNGFTKDEEKNKAINSAFIGQENWQEGPESFYVLVFGQDIKNPKLEAYQDGSLKKVMGNGGGDLVRYESDLFTFVDMLVKDYQNNKGREDIRLIDQMDQEEIKKVIYKEYKDSKNDFMDFVEIMNQILVEQRIFLIEFEIEDKEETRISLSYKKPASMDFTGDRKSTYFYDLGPSGNEKIDFSKLSLSLINTDEVNFIQDNLGEKIKEDMTNINLDTNNYYHFRFDYK